MPHQNLLNRMHIIFLEKQNRYYQTFKPPHHLSSHRQNALSFSQLLSTFSHYSSQILYFSLNFLKTIFLVFSEICTYTSREREREKEFHCDTVSSKLQIVSLSSIAITWFLSSDFVVFLSWHLIGFGLGKYQLPCNLDVSYIWMCVKKYWSLINYFIFSFVIWEFMVWVYMLKLAVYLCVMCFWSRSIQ